MSFTDLLLLCGLCIPCCHFCTPVLQTFWNNLPIHKLVFPPSRMCFLLFDISSVVLFSYILIYSSGLKVSASLLIYPPIHPFTHPFSHQFIHQFTNLFFCRLSIIFISFIVSGIIVGVRKYISWYCEFCFLCNGNKQTNSHPRYFLMTKIKQKGTRVNSFGWGK